MSKHEGHLFSGVAFCLSAILLLSAGTGCKKFQRKHLPIDAAAELGYPTCPGAAQTGKGTLLGSGHVRSGPTHPDPSVVERYEVRQRDCLTIATVRQEWPLATADVEVVYDTQGLPLRIWKRMTLPGVRDPAARMDLRRYELRQDPVIIKRRFEDGHIGYEQLLGGRPRAVIGPGRGIIAMWIRRAKLKVGEKLRELAIDVRALEKIEPVTLLREADMNDPELGGHVQVYTFYGRETVFTNAEGFVVGDLMGLRPHALLRTPAPPGIPLFAPLDPVGTP